MSFGEGDLHDRVEKLESLVLDMYEYLGSYGAAMDSFGYRNGPRVRAEFGERMDALGLLEGGERWRIR